MNFLCTFFILSIHLRLANNLRNAQILCKRSDVQIQGHVRISIFFSDDTHFVNFTGHWTTDDELYVSATERTILLYKLLN